MSLNKVATMCGVVEEKQDTLVLCDTDSPDTKCALFYNFSSSPASRGGYAPSDRKLAGLYVHKAQCLKAVDPTLQRVDTTA